MVESPRLLALRGLSQRLGSICVLLNACGPSTQRADADARMDPLAGSDGNAQFAFKKHDSAEICGKSMPALIETPGWSDFRLARDDGQGQTAVPSISA